MADDEFGELSEDELDALVEQAMSTQVIAGVLDEGDPVPPGTPPGSLFLIRKRD